MLNIFWAIVNSTCSIYKSGFRYLGSYSWKNTPNSLDISKYTQMLKSCLFLFISSTQFATMATRRATTANPDFPVPTHLPTTLYCSLRCQTRSLDKQGPCSSKKKQKTNLSSFSRWPLWKCSPTRPRQPHIPQTCPPNPFQPEFYLSSTRQLAPVTPARPLHLPTSGTWPRAPQTIPSPNSNNSWTSNKSDAPGEEKIAFLNTQPCILGCKSRIFGNYLFSGKPHACNSSRVQLTPPTPNTPTHTPVHAM